MKILFEQGTPVHLRKYVQSHTVTTTFELGWSTLKNGELLDAAEAIFDCFITTDQNLRYQQNLSDRKLAIVVLMSTSWPRLRESIPKIGEVVDEVRTGEYREIIIP